MSASGVDQASSREPLPESLAEIHKVLVSIRQDYRQLAGTMEALQGKVNIIAGIKQVSNATVADLTPMINFPT